MGFDVKLCLKECPQPQPPPGIDHKTHPRWKTYSPIVCGQEQGHDGKHGGPYLWWN